MEGLAGPRDTPVDILVATPGRLMAHLRSTPGASLEHLSYLVRGLHTQHVNATTDALIQASSALHLSGALQTV